MILILGGTSESRELAIECAKLPCSVLYASTTAMIDALPESIERWIGFLTPQVFEYLIRNRNISYVIDATHPFAVQISQLAVNMCKQAGLPYMRLERESLKDELNEPFVMQVNSIEAIVAIAKVIPGNILSTIGVRKLPELIQKIGDRKDLFYARVLPTVESLQTCERAGITPAKVIALQGPFSREFEKSLINELKICALISKESGVRGGMQAKLDACRDTGCTLIVLMRPQIAYPRMCTTAQECINWIHC